MYCEHCGKKIDSDSVFCTYCGKKVKMEEEPKIKKKIVSRAKIEKKKNINKKILIIILMILFGVIFYYELKYFNSAENAINQYLKDWENKNYDSILNTLDIETDDFITKEIFTKEAQETKESKMKDFQITSCDYENNNRVAKCHITYKIDKFGTTYEKTYLLQRERTNRLGIFAEWKIENKDFEILENWTLYIPKDSIGTLEQKNIEKYRNIEKDKTGYDAYTIDKVLKGNYNLNLKLNTGIQLDSQIKINNQEYTYQFNIKNISEEYKKEIKKVGEDVINSLYSGIIEKKKLEEIDSEYEISALKTTYETVKKEIEKEITLKSFNIKDIKMTGIEMLENGNLYITYQMNYQYSFTYMKEKEEIVHKGESNDTFHMTIKNANLNEIEKIESLVTYFSKKY